MPDTTHANVFEPTLELVVYMAEHDLKWVHRHQRFEAGDWNWHAGIGVCLDGKWKAMRMYDDGAVGTPAHHWESAKFDDPIACLVNAKLENWGN